MKTLTWVSRIAALCILIFALPFYFGYGNPLPFANPNYSLWDNVVLVMMPLMFIGLALGWKYPRAGGLLATIPVVAVFLTGLLTHTDFSVNLLVPFAVGMLYLADGYILKREE